MKIIKRNGSEAVFDITKIIAAKDGIHTDASISLSVPEFNLETIELIPVPKYAEPCPQIVR